MSVNLSISSHTRPLLTNPESPLPIPILPHCKTPPPSHHDLVSPVSSCSRARTLQAISIYTVTRFTSPRVPPSNPNVLLTNGVTSSCNLISPRISSDFLSQLVRSSCESRVSTVCNMKPQAEITAATKRRQRCGRLRNRRPLEVHTSRPRAS